MNPVAEAFRRVVALLEARGIDYVVVGSTAAAAWGVIRSTRDVDLVMAIPPLGTALLDELLADDVYVPIDFARTALAEGGSFNVLHLAASATSRAPRLQGRLESRSEVQWRDCMELAAIHDLDCSYFDRWAPVLGVVDDLALLLAAAADGRTS